LVHTAARHPNWTYRLADERSHWTLLSETTAVSFLG
jgi:hypothetical protein